MPAGVREGGQWTADGGETTTLSAQRRRGGGGGPVGGLEPTPAQAARLTVAEAQAQAAIARVRQYDRNWQPTPSLYETVEGQIAARQADTREAEARLAELAGVGVGPGPFAVESIAAGPSVTAADRIELNRIFSEYGCHTCGTFEAGTKSGNPIADHQPPTALRALGSSARLFPQCVSCSVRQGGYVRSLSGR